VVKKEPLFLDDGVLLYYNKIIKFKLEKVPQRIASTADRKLFSTSESKEEL